VFLGYRVAVLVVFVRFTVKLLLKASDPFVDCLLCLLEALLDVLADLREVIYLLLMSVTPLKHN
jgi:hypothetical protein